MAWFGARARGELGHEQPFRCHAFEEVFVIIGITDVYPRTEHTDSTTDALQPGKMRFTVDTARHAGDDGHTCTGKVAGELRRHAHPLPGTQPRPDHPQRRIVQQCHIPRAVEQSGSIGERAQPLGITWVVP